MRLPVRAVGLLIAAALTGAAFGETAEAEDICSMCAVWNKPHAPFKIYGNAYYVGTAAIAVVLITSPQGHILIDGAIAESVPQIVANIKTLGFKIEDVKLVLNSHVHLDHAGGLSQLQQLSGAAVKASPLSAPVLKSGKVGTNDPQAATLPPIAPVAKVTTVKDGEVLHVGPLAIKAVFTPGHTPGGTTWTWDSCEGSRCLHLVYADSVNPVSSPKFRYSDSPDYPGAIADFGKSIAAFTALPCDIILSVHPEFSNFWTRLERREAGDQDALIDVNGCKRYADNVRLALDKRLEAERAQEK